MSENEQADEASETPDVYQILDALLEETTTLPRLFAWPELEDEGVYFFPISLVESVAYNGTRLSVEAPNGPYVTKDEGLIGRFFAEWVIV